MSDLVAIPMLRRPCSFFDQKSCVLFFSFLKKKRLFIKALILTATGLISFMEFQLKTTKICRLVDDESQIKRTIEIFPIFHYYFFSCL